MALNCWHEFCTLRLSANHCPKAWCRSSTSRMGNAVGNKRCSRTFRAMYDAQPCAAFFDFLFHVVDFSGFPTLRVQLWRTQNSRRQHFVSSFEASADSLGRCKRRYASQQVRNGIQAQLVNILAGWLSCHKNGRAQGGGQNKEQTSRRSRSLVAQHI